MIKFWMRDAIVAVAVMAGVMSVPSAASAQTFTFTGSTQGAFNSNTLGGSDTLGGLTFNSGSFSVQAPAFVGGQASIGTGMGPGGSPPADTLGSFTLGATPFTYAGNTFTLAVSFTAPAGTTPGTQSTTALLTGQVVPSTSGPAGGVTVNFTSVPLAFAFPVGGVVGAGAFTLQVNPVDLTPSATPTAVSVTGRILVTAVPGPVAGAGIPAILGLAGVWYLRRRRLLAN